VAKDPVQNRSLILRVFLPFVVGYYIAYLFRTINAVMAAPLATELGLGADDLGLLTSVYFLTFAAAQIPIGILLDRSPPRSRRPSMTRRPANISSFRKARA
jgi:sugar phosphate permease